MREIQMRIALVVVLIIAAIFFGTVRARADIIGEVSTAWNLGGNDKILVESFPDPEIAGVACWISYAKTGGFLGQMGLAEDKARFSVACRQVGPIVMKPEFENAKEVKANKANIFTKHNRVVRMYDKPNNTLIYLIYSDRAIDGSPQNSLSVVPIQPWNN